MRPCSRRVLPTRRGWGRSFFERHNQKAYLGAPKDTGGGRASARPLIQEEIKAWQIFCTPNLRRKTWWAEVGRRSVPDGRQPREGSPGAQCRAGRSGFPRRPAHCAGRRGPFDDTSGGGTGGWPARSAGQPTTAGRVGRREVPAGPFAGFSPPGAKCRAAGFPGPLFCESGPGGFSAGDF